MSTLAPELALARPWVSTGTALFADRLAALTEAQFTAPTQLPGWSPAHLCAHVASNAEALGRLATWARTGVETPMYASPAARDADIERGATGDRAALTGRVRDSATDLDAQFDDLDARVWAATVTTIQGRDLPATALPWLRAREVCVHAVDISGGAITFDDLPGDFVTALLDDVVTRRSSTSSGPALLLRSADTGAHREIDGVGTPVEVTGTDAALAGWLTGRTSSPDDIDCDADIPTLPRWL